MPSIESNMIEEGLKEFFLFINTRREIYGMKTVLFIVVMTMWTLVIGGGKNSNLSILRGIEYMGCNDSLEIKHFRKLWSVFLCNILIVLKSYCWNAIYSTKE